MGILVVSSRFSFSTLFPEIKFKKIVPFTM